MNRNVRFTTPQCLRTTALAIATLAVCLIGLQAGTIFLPNASFELPLVPPVSPFAGPDVDSWQKTAQPAWYDPATNNFAPWDYLMGTFTNAPSPPPPSPETFIDNCDGNQAAFLLALPEVGLFQDYDSLSGTNTTPSHAFDAKFNIGKAYTLTAGLIGGGGGMKPGVTIELGLYYRDAASNMVTVAAISITNSEAAFPTNTHFVDYQVQTPGVKASDLWAGQNIGIRLLSTVDHAIDGGYWDVDNVRLNETATPALINPGVTNSQSTFTMLSEPGLDFEILVSTNLLNPNSWTSIGTITNLSGIGLFTDTNSSFNRRFYRARQAP
jgi:hypothetical protein